MGGRSAVGFIETRGLIGVIEAADTAVKAAQVEILGFRQVGDGIVSVQMRGDVASVQVAVQAAAKAAARISTVISQHVIPAPHEEVGQRLTTSEAKRDVPASSPAPDLAPQNVQESSSAIPSSWQELEGWPVPKLRRLLRKLPGEHLHGRAVSRANRATLLEELKRILSESEAVPTEGDR